MWEKTLNFICTLYHRNHFLSVLFSGGNYIHNVLSLLKLLPFRWDLQCRFNLPYIHGSISGLYFIPLIHLNIPLSLHLNTSANTIIIQLGNKFWYRVGKISHLTLPYFFLKFGLPCKFWNQSRVPSKPHWEFNETCIEFMGQFGKNCYVQDIESSHPWTWHMCLLRSSLMNFNKILLFPSYRFCTFYFYCSHKWFFF